MHYLKKIQKLNVAGFTLLELLVVVAIIGFLSSVSIVALSASKSKSRDTQRKLDQVTILKAAELYTNDFGVPPTQLCRDTNLNDSNPCTGSTSVLVPSKESIESKISDLFSVPTAQASCFIQTCPVCWQWVGHSDSHGNCSGSCEPVDGCVVPPSNCVVDNYCDAETGENASNCPADCGCNNNAVCEGNRGENISNCPSDCSIGSSPNGGGSPTPPATCGQKPIKCDVGETPGNCPSDCTDTSICWNGTSFDSCCMLAGNYCSGTPASGEGYYGVCNNNRCEQKYLLQPPAFKCTVDADCTPGVSNGITSPQQEFVSNNDPNWLEGLSPYMVNLPHDPGGHSDARYNVYYVSSNPDIVHAHKICVFVSYERDSDNFNPYNDITQSPTGNGAELLHWTPLCAQ